MTKDVEVASKCTLRIEYGCESLVQCVYVRVYVSLICCDWTLIAILCQMPNTGMLDHQAFRPTPTEVRPRSVTYWMQPWPSQSGYETLRSASARAERALHFSRYLQQAQPSSNQTRSVLKGDHLTLG